MNYQYSDFEFALCAIRILGIIGCVAIVAYFLKNRALFVAGAIGSFLGCVAPHGGVHINGTAEEVYIGQLQWTASSVLWYGVIGSLGSCLFVMALQRMLPEPKAQYSIRGLLILMTFVAVILGAFQWMSK